MKMVKRDKKNTVTAPFKKNIPKHVTKRVRITAPTNKIQLNFKRAILSKFISSKVTSSLFNIVS